MSKKMARTERKGMGLEKKSSISFISGALRMNAITRKFKFTENRQCTQKNRELKIKCDFCFCSYKMKDEREKKQQLCTFEQPCTMHRYNRELTISQSFGKIKQQQQYNRYENAKNKAFALSCILRLHRSNLSDWRETRSTNESVQSKINTNCNFPKSKINIQLNFPKSKWTQPNVKEKTLREKKRTECIQR